jgi:hypothetical protein
VISLYTFPCTLITLTLTQWQYELLQRFCTTSGVRRVQLWSIWQIPRRLTHVLEWIDAGMVESVPEWITYLLVICLGL